MKKELDIASALTVEQRFPVSLIIRPHHLYLPCAQDALLRRSNPQKIAESTINSFVESASDNPDGYWTDLLGPSLKGRNQFATNLEGYLRKLRRLSNYSYVNLDSQPDGICGSCVIGDHCLSFNYRSSTGTESKGISDNEAIMRIKERLKANGFTAGEDFLERQTIHVRFNLHGQTLDQYRISKKESGHIMELPSLIARVGALRKIL